MTISPLQLSSQLTARISLTNLADPQMQTIPALLLTSSIPETCASTADRSVGPSLGCASFRRE